ncbi:MAG: hypothetical protein KGD63_09460 [Candidatus Lokiarchaeota archaeon]|nr:hypothetical protein [Candidatus Lokiarchaeota archaeon]
MNKAINNKKITSNNATPDLTLENHYVQKIISIAQQMIRENKPMKIEKLYNKSIKELDINSNELFKIIQYLVNQKVLIDGSKHTRNTILSNSYRNKLYQVISENHGASFNFLRKKVFSNTSGSGGQLIWHLQMLIKFNYIKKIKINNYTVFIPYDMDTELGKLFFFMKDGLNEKIINIINNQEKIRKPDVYKILDESRSNVNYRIKNLLEHDILKVIDNTTKIVSIHPNIEKKLTQIIKKNVRILDYNQ